jgi:predicted HNH restriction endonuclease
VCSSITTDPKKVDRLAEPAGRTDVAFALHLSPVDSLIYIDDAFEEGVARRVTSNVYERNKAARQRCLDHYGLSCFVCTFNFDKVYPEISKGYIHVHHRELISTKGVNLVDPIKDLVPVCPNCHAMLHSKKAPLIPEELREVVMKARATSSV